MLANGDVDLAVALAMAPVQLVVDRVAHQVVGKESRRAALDGAERGEPVEQVARAFGVDRVGQQRLGRHAGMGTDLERTPVQLGRPLRREALRELAHDVAAELLRHLARCGDDIGEQRERQGMAVAQPQDPIVARAGDAARVEVAHARVGGKVAQRDHARAFAPERIGAPSWVGRAPAGDEHARRRRQLAEHGLAEPAGEVLDALEGVDHQQPAWQSHAAVEDTGQARAFGR